MKKSVFLSGTANEGKSGIGTCPALEGALINLGYKIANMPDADFLISLNHNNFAFKEFLKKGGNQASTYLVLLEPESVYPSQYSPKILQKYKRLVTPGSSRFNLIGDDFIGWPYAFNLNPSQPKDSDGSLKSYISSIKEKDIYNYESWINRKAVCTMIAANKVSPTKRNQYGLRRYFAKNLSPALLEVYGPLWTDPLHRKIWIRVVAILASLKWKHLPNISSCYGNLFWKYPGAKGEVENKHDVLLQSKFSIVVENNAEYVSEKLLDAVINGSVPFYFGPDLMSVGLPPGIAIQNFKSVEEVKKYLSEYEPGEIMEILRNMKLLLDSDRFHKQWNYDLVFQQIALDFHNQVGTT